MTLEYNIEENGTIWYEKDGVRISFGQNPENSDYQRYLRWLENPNEEEQGGLI